MAAEGIVSRAWCGWGLVWKDERKPQPIALSSGARKPTLCEEPFEKDDAEGLARLHALEAALRPIQT
jgi:hypothetical protein